MSDCHAFRKLIDEYLDGTISDGQRKELETHARTCRDCAEQLRGNRLMQEVIADAFVARTPVREARERLLTELADRRLHPACPRGNLVIGARWAVAAVILLAAGLSLGFVLGRQGSAGPAPARLSRAVPMRVAELTGTVLVRHQGAEVWHTLTPEAAIHVGDTFHAAAKSGLTLKVADKSTIRIEQNSTLILKSYNGETQFYLEHGQCRADLESPHGPFFISTPHGRVEALGTEFTVTVE